MRNDDIRHAARLLMRIFKGESLENVVAVAGPKLDSARIRAWVYGVCRHYFSLSEQLGKLCMTPLPRLDREVLAVLLLGAFQLVHTETKPHAIVSESVEAIKRLRKQSAAYLVNAVLRKVDRDYRPSTVSGKHELPDWLVDKLRVAYGDALLYRFLKHLNARMPQCLRVNCHKISAQAFQSVLRDHNIAFTILRDPGTIRLCQPQPTRTIPGYAEGWFTVQDASAQLPVRELNVRAGLRVLDACAAPGNKSFQLLEHGVDLTALDINPARSEWYKLESRRLDLPLTITLADATTKDWWDGKPYDRVLLDAPCSATGTIGRHPDVKLHREPPQFESLQAGQVELMTNLWDVLAPGGTFVYATCSLLPEENDAVVSTVVDKQVDAETVAIDFHSSNQPLVMSQDFGIQVFPHPNWGDGFYMAKLQKHAHAS